jgi:DNA polymerase V
VARVRAALGISQGALARRLGLSQSAIYMYEDGKRPIPGPVAIMCRQLLESGDLAITRFKSVQLRPEIYRAAEIIENRPGIPLLCPVPAGWPSPSEDYVEDQLDLQTLAVRNPAATFFLRAMGESMVGAGIHDGDLLVVDRSKAPVTGKVVIASVDGELTIKRLVKRNGRVFLTPANPQFSEIDITGREDASVWGVVTYVLHAL